MTSSYDDEERRAKSVGLALSVPGADVTNIVTVASQIEKFIKGGSTN